MQIGVDLTRISSFENKKESFIKRILSPQEFLAYQQTPKNLQTLFLARSWAIKEAIFKADNRHFSFAKINIYKKNNVWNFKNFKISISHEGDYLIAFVINLKESNEKN
ncbi:holo-ACP synthase [Mycoplasmopsis mustelae]